MDRLTILLRINEHLGIPSEDITLPSNEYCHKEFIILGVLLVSGISGEKHREREKSFSFTPLPLSRPLSAFSK